MGNKWGLLCGILLLASPIVAERAVVPDEVLILTDPTPSLGILSAQNIETDPVVSKIELIRGADSSMTSNAFRKYRHRTLKRQWNLHRIKLRPGANPTTVAQRWRTARLGRSQVQIAQPNYIYTTRVVSHNDPLSTTGNNFISLTHTDAAWDYTTGSGSIIIAIIDTGTRITHEDLSDRLWVNPGETVDGIDNDNNGYIDDINGANTGAGQNLGNVTGDLGHGTHVAGIIGAKMNNAAGIAGVCPSCNIMTLKANEPNMDAFYSSRIIESLEYAAEMGADVINMSLGASGTDEAIHNAIKEVTNAGVIVVAAAGNDQENIHNSFQMPASYPEVIAVSATDGTAFDHSYSNFGPEILVSAPGTQIASTWVKSNTSYAFDSGTSMATPVVSGAIGLLKSLQPRLTTANVRTLLQTYSDDLGTSGKDDYYGYGFLNVYTLLSAIASDNSAPTIPSASIPTRAYYEDRIPIRVVVTDNNVILPDVVGTSQFYTGSTLMTTTVATASYQGNSIYEFTISTSNPSISSILVSISAIDINDNQAHYPTAEITMVDLHAPTVATPPSFITDQLAGILKLPISDITGISTADTRVQYGSQVYTNELNPSTIYFTGSTLNIVLADIGFIPSTSTTVSVYTNDTLNNHATTDITVGSSAPPSITFVTQPNDYIGAGTRLSFTVTDTEGVSVNTLSLTFQTATQSQTLRYPADVASISIALPSIYVTIPDTIIPYQSTMDALVTIHDIFTTVSTQSIALQTSQTLTVSGTSKSQFLAYPNPFNPKVEGCSIAYTLSKSANSGEILIYDLGLKRIRTIRIAGTALVAGYNEVTWDGKDSSGDWIPNGVYIAVAVISDGPSTIKMRQKIAVLYQ